MRKLRYLTTMTLALAAVIILCSCKSTSPQCKFDGMSSSKLGMTRDSVVACDNKDYGSAATYKTYSSEDYTRIEFEDGMRKYVFDKNDKLVQIELITQNEDFISELQSMYGEPSEIKEDLYSWNGTMTGIDATLKAKAVSGYVVISIKAD